MSDTSFWNQDWMETQQKYWQSWTDLGRRALGAEASPTQKSPWEQALDHWWKAVSPATSGLAQDFMGKMMEQGKTFFRMADSFGRNMGAGGDTQSWNEALYKTLDEMQQAFGGGITEGDDAVHKMMAFWEMPFDNWQRMVSSLSPTPGDALRNMPHEQVKESLHRFLSAPGLGYAREEQASYQDLMRRTLDYQKALQEYMQFFSHLGLKSAERMRQRVQAVGEQDQPVDSARTLYDLWVGCCEEVYGEEVMTPEYAAIHGKMVNALMALKHRMAVMVDETLGTLNMPTRAELRTLQDRVQETRRENKALRHELDSLKQQVASLVRPAPPAVPRKKITARKKTAVRKTSARRTEQGAGGQ